MDPEDISPSLLQEQIDTVRGLYGVLSLDIQKLHKKQKQIDQAFSMRRALDQQLNSVYHGRKDRCSENIGTRLQALENLFDRVDNSVAIINEWSETFAGMDDHINKLEEIAMYLVTDQVNLDKTLRKNRRDVNKHIKKLTNSLQVLRSAVNDISQRAICLEEREVSLETKFSLIEFRSQMLLCSNVVLLMAICWYTLDSYIWNFCHRLQEIIKAVFYDRQIEYDNKESELDVSDVDAQLFSGNL